MSDEEIIVFTATSKETAGTQLSASTSLYFPPVTSFRVAPDQQRVWIHGTNPTTGGPRPESFPHGVYAGDFLRLGSLVSSTTEMGIQTWDHVVGSGDADDAHPRPTSAEDEEVRTFLGTAGPAPAGEDVGSSALQRTLSGGSRAPAETEEARAQTQEQEHHGTAPLESGASSPLTGLSGFSGGAAGGPPLRRLSMMASTSTSTWRTSTSTAPLYDGIDLDLHLEDIDLDSPAAKGLPVHGGRPRGGGQARVAQLPLLQLEGAEASFAQLQARRTSEQVFGDDTPEEVLTPEDDIIPPSQSGEGAVPVEPLPPPQRHILRKLLAQDVEDLHRLCRFFIFTLAPRSSGGDPRPEDGVEVTGPRWRRDENCRKLEVVDESGRKFSWLTTLGQQWFSATCRVGHMLLAEPSTAPPTGLGPATTNRPRPTSLFPDLQRPGTSHQEQERDRQQLAALQQLSEADLPYDYLQLTAREIAETLLEGVKKGFLLKKAVATYLRLSLLSSTTRKDALGLYVESWTRDRISAYFLQHRPLEGPDPERPPPAWSHPCLAAPLWHGGGPPREPSASRIPVDGDAPPTALRHPERVTIASMPNDPEQGRAVPAPPASGASRIPPADAPPTALRHPERVTIATMPKSDLEQGRAAPAPPAPAASATGGGNLLTKIRSVANNAAAEIKKRRQQRTEAPAHVKQERGKVRRIAKFLFSLLEAALSDHLVDPNFNGGIGMNDFEESAVRNDVFLDFFLQTLLAHENVVLVWDKWWAFEGNNAGMPDDFLRTLFHTARIAAHDYHQIDKKISYWDLGGDKAQFLECWSAGMSRGPRRAAVVRPSISQVVLHHFWKHRHKLPAAALPSTVTRSVPGGLETMEGLERTCARPGRFLAILAAVGVASLCYGSFGRCAAGAEVVPSSALNLVPVNFTTTDILAAAQLETTTAAPPEEPPFQKNRGKSHNHWIADVADFMGSGMRVADRVANPALCAPRSLYSVIVPPLPAAPGYCAACRLVLVFVLGVYWHVSGEERKRDWDDWWQDKADLQADTASRGFLFGIFSGWSCWSGWFRAQFGKWSKDRRIFSCTRVMSAAELSVSVSIGLRKKCRYSQHHVLHQLLDHQYLSIQIVYFHQGSLSQNGVNLRPCSVREHCSLSFERRLARWPRTSTRSQPGSRNCPRREEETPTDTSWVLFGGM